MCLQCLMANDAPDSSGPPPIDPCLTGGGGAPPTPPPTPPPTDAIVGAIDVVSATAGGVAGFAITVRATITLDATQTNVYAMAGTEETPMSFPPAYQCATPFGADIGGASPAFFAIANNAALGYAEFDSWLTVGITDGTQGPISASPGFDLGAWTDSAGISTTNAAIFFMDPGTMGANSGTDPIVMAQMTVSAETAAGGTATATLQGRSAGGAEDWQSPVVWTW